MEPVVYCQDVLARLAPEQLFAIDLVAGTDRHAALAIEALIQTVRDVTAPGKDADVARIKLTWWRTELQRCHDGDARHPITQLWHSLDKSKHLTAECIANLTAPAEAELDPPPLADPISWTSAARGEGGILAAEAVGDASAQLRQLFDELAARRRALHWLRRARDDARAGRLMLPLSALAKFSIDRQRIAANGVPGEMVSELADMRVGGWLPAVDRAAVSLHVDMALAAAEGKRAGERPSIVKRNWLVWRAIRRARKA